MYVGDRDTYYDTFCQICGEIADVNRRGLCEDCTDEVGYQDEQDGIAVTWLCCCCGETFYDCECEGDEAWICISS